MPAATQSSEFQKAVEESRKLKQTPTNEEMLDVCFFPMIDGILYTSWISSYIRVVIIIIFIPNIQKSFSVTNVLRYLPPL